MKRIHAGTILLTCAAWASAGQLNFEARVRTALGSLRDEPRLTSSQLAAGLDFEQELAETHLRAKGEIVYEGIYDLRPQRYSEAAADEYRLSPFIHEAYAQRTIGQVDFAVGYQRIAWGISDEIRILDVMSPYDYRDFLLAGIERMRLSVPAVRVSGYAGSTHVEAVYLPFFTSDANPVAGSEFGVLPEVGLPVVYERGPSRTWNPAHWRGGLHVKRTFGALDVGLCGAYGRSPTPFLSSSIGFDAVGNPHLVLRESYERQGFAGYHLSWAAGEFVFRHEAGIVPERTFSGKAPGETFTSPYVNAMAGVDYLHRDILFGLQVSDRQIYRWDGAYADPERQPFVTLSAKGNALANRLDYKLATAVMLREGDGGLLQGKASYSISDPVSLEAGFDALWGDDGGTFGSYPRADRSYMGIVLHI